MINPELTNATNIAWTYNTNVLSTLFQYAILALCISLIWNSIIKKYGKQHEYNKNYPKIFGIYLIPLIMWTLGLTTMMTIYDFIAHKFVLQTFVIQLIIFSLSYWILLIIIELIKYKIFKKNNEKAKKYLEIILLKETHTPRWMQIIYFSNGIIMFLLCKIAGITGLF
jgi:hypothetical protein